MKKATTRSGKLAPRTRATAPRKRAASKPGRAPKSAARSTKTPDVASRVEAVGPPAGGKSLELPSTVINRPTPKRGTARYRKSRERAREVLNRHAKRLLAIPGVTGLHLGPKRVKGEIVNPNECVICIEVSKKRRQGHPMNLTELPTEIDGVPTDVVERSCRLTNGEGRKLERFDTMGGGIAIAPAALDKWGTLGIRVLAEKGNQLVPALISNRHVIGTQGDIIQPASGSEVVGKVIRSQSSLDCAIARDTGSRPFGNFIYGGGPGLTYIAGHFEIGQLVEDDAHFEHGSTVFFLGARTGESKFRYFRVEEIAGVSNTEFGQMSNVIKARLIDGNAIPVKSGDSGSALIKAISRAGKVVYQVVGLVFGEEEGGRVVCATHFASVAAKLKIQLDN